MGLNLIVDGKNVEIGFPAVMGILDRKSVV
jgi:hypothetical protein